MTKTKYFKYLSRNKARNDEADLARAISIYFGGLTAQKKNACLKYISNLTDASMTMSFEKLYD